MIKLELLNILEDFNEDAVIVINHKGYDMNPIYNEKSSDGRILVLSTDQE